MERLEELSEKIFSNGINFLRDLKWNCSIKDFRNFLILELKKETEICIYFPPCISLNNCLGFYSPCEDDKLCIKNGDIIKVEYGIRNLDGKNKFLFGKTFIADNINSDSSSSSSSNLPIYFLENLYKKIKKEEFSCTDDLRMFIESECAENKFVPIQNCLSFQQETDDYTSSYFYLNYKKEYDSNDYLIGLENLNFDINSGDIFDINLTILPEKDNQKFQTYSKPTQLFKIDEFNRINLKLKSSRMIYNLAKKTYGDDVFCFNDLSLNNSNLSKAQAKIGLADCVKKEVFEEFPILFIKGDDPVYYRKFSFKFR